MQVLNVHRRTLPVAPERVAERVHSLGGQGDRLRPRDRWPALRPDAPLPGALIEDALNRAERDVGGNPTPVAWSPWVRLLRRIFRGRR